MSFLRKLFKKGENGPELDQRVMALTRVASDFGYDAKLRDCPEACVLLDVDAEERALVIRDCLRQLNAPGVNPGSGHIQEWLGKVAGLLLRKKTEFSDEQVAEILDSLAGQWSEPTGTIVSMLERRYGESDVLPAVVHGSLRAYRQKLANKGRSYDDVRAAADRIDELLIPKKDRSTFSIGVVDAWTGALHEGLEELAEDVREPWNAFLEYCSTAKSAKPSTKWLRNVEPLMNALTGHEAVVVRVLHSVGRASTVPILIPGWGGTEMEQERTIPSQKHSDCLRGLIWSIGVNPTDELVEGLGDASSAAFKKLPNIGPRAPKIGNACVHVLGHHCGLRGVAQLSRLKTRVKHPSSRNQIEKALTAAAEKNGMTGADLEDIAVPDCGLAEVGRLEKRLGDFTGLITVDGPSQVTLAWRTESGKEQKSIPKSVQEQQGDSLAQLQKIVKELKAFVPVQRDRIERQMLFPRSLPFDEWKKRYLDHPVVGILARKLIWTVRREEARQVLFLDDKLVDVTGKAFEPAPGGAVELWHPIESSAGEVQTWRGLLEKHRITQPFKQAHREIYLLTDAERRTDTYSNRFAAHVLKQHQLSALLQARQWRYTLQGAWDSANTPYRDLPELGYRIEYYVDPTGHGEQTEAGIFLYLISDQVRFYRLGEDGALSLENVPARIFSEGMRDVDLFVGVASVGNDPNWQDGGPQGRYVDYWNSYAFGELSATAETRRAALARLLPMLKIHDKCRLEGRFLHVEGKLRGYKIHLGSGNILMTPNDQYLCIVPGRSATNPRDVTLPFEGDGMFSLILSKALLLAADDEIKDRTIQTQIGISHYGSKI